MSEHEHNLRATWPIHKRQTAELVGGWVVLTALWIGMGKLLLGPLAHGTIVRTDERVAHWWVGQRTPTLNHATVWGSYLAETLPKVIVTVLLALLFLRLWHRWFEALFISIALIVEAAAFITVTTIVGRHRPDVPRLDGSPVGSSFPSGHTAAAMAYVAITIVVIWHTRKVWVRALVITLSVLVPIIVAISRMYRGMHFLSDTIAGALLGGAAVAWTAFVMVRSPEAVPVVGDRGQSNEPPRIPLGPADRDRAVL